jgi:hypothetical protein
MTENIQKIQNTAPAIPTGAVWHKWDLHFHTPASFDYGNEATSFEELADRINRSDLDAIAITDHWTLDGYEKLRPFIKNKLVIPGIELRTDKSARSNPLKTGGEGSGVIQAILLFPPNLDLKEDIEKNFLHQIYLCEREESGLKITRKDLVELGKKHSGKSGLSEKQYYDLGCGQAYIDYVKAAKAAQKLGGLVCLTYEKHGGFDSIDPINDSIFKSNLVKDCDLVETGKEEIRRSFFEHTDILKCCGKKTPCFRGSDAHRKEDVGKRYTWIKSELSFEGLKQIKYFPKERVSFAEQRPTYSYPRIKSISLTNIDKNHPLGTLAAPVHFNDNLNAIIGHPSIGKSTLAELIAYTFDQETKQEEGEAQTKIEYLQEVNPNLEAQIEVAVGATTSKISRNLEGAVGGDLEMHEFSLTYINQGYIDRTARDSGAVNELVTAKLKEPELARTAGQMKQTADQLKVQRNKYLGRFVLEREKQGLVEELAKTEKMSKLSESAANKKLGEHLEEATKKERALKSALKELKNLEEILSRYSAELAQIHITPASIETLFPSIKGVKIPKISTLAADPLLDITALIKKVEEAIEFEKVKAERKDLMDKRKTLFEKEGITVSAAKLAEAEKLKESLAQSVTEKQEEIAECFKGKESVATLVKTLLEWKKQYEDLNAASLIEFNTGLEKIQAVYEPAELEPWLLTVLTDEAKEAWDKFTPAEEKKNAKFIKPSEDDIGKLINRMKKDKQCETAGAVAHIQKSLDEGMLPFKDKDPAGHIKWLFGSNGPVLPEFLKLRLQEFALLGKNQVCYDGKNISTEGLSFTERCSALLEIILQKGEEPLLIDQPEENLGSGYVAKILTEKLLKRKMERQIIVISHNPNTVVLADSDMVIALDHRQGGDDIELKMGSIEAGGMQDVVCNIIEGGKDAFKIRYERYLISGQGAAQESELQGAETAPKSKARASQETAGTASV